MGIKREASGTAVEKNPLADVELSDEDATKLQEVQKDIARCELVLGTSFSARAPHR
jgi:template-activating factor I